MKKCLLIMMMLVALAPAAMGQRNAALKEGSKIVAEQRSHAPE